MLALFTVGRTQNYFREYPVNAAIAFNGNQQRLECSVYDSSLQAMVYYYSPWTTNTIQITDNKNGKVGFISWNNPGSQAEWHGFLIYDYILKQFNVKELIADIAGGYNVNVKTGPIWALVVRERYVQTMYFLYYDYYWYNINLHTWNKVTIFTDTQYSSSVWFKNSTGNSDMVSYIDDDDEGVFYRYSPLSNGTAAIFAGCSAWETIVFDDHLITDGGCNDDYVFSTQHNIYPEGNLWGGMERGIFIASKTTNSDETFIFTYDEGTQQWITDYLNTQYLTNVQVRDRVVAYAVEDPALGIGAGRVYFMAHDPLQGAWVKDSVDLLGGLTQLSIQNGTVSIGDANGVIIKGYDVNLGWGNYSTPIFMHFSLNNYFANGLPLLHVRNTSIGITTSTIDFGDGTITLNGRQSLWHQYRDSGTYNICIYDSTGINSWCQQITVNLCSQPGSIAISDTTVCEGDTITLSLTGYNGSIQWQRNSGSGWINETGPGFDSDVYLVVPTSSVIFRAQVTEGLCLPGYSLEKSVVVYENPDSVYLPDTLVMICQGKPLFTRVMNPSSTYTYQWQSWNGSSWNTASGTTTNFHYTAVPTTNMQYRVIINSGGCFSKITDTLNVLVDPLPPVPVAQNAYTCGSGTVQLNTSGSSYFNWYLPPILDSVIASGNFFTPSITATTTFAVQASSGPTATGGYPDQTVGSISIGDNSKKGVRFYMNSPALLQSVSVYPSQTGWVQLMVINANSGASLGVSTVSVSSINGKIRIPLNLYLQGNTTYDIIPVNNSVPFDVNVSGFSYPVSSPGSPLSVLGYVDSVFHDTPDFYNFYDFVLISGCQSNTVNVQGIVEPPMGNVTLNQSGTISFCEGDSVQLSLTMSGVLTYQWNNNLYQIPGANNFYLNVKKPGNYSVTVSSNACTETSNTVQVEVPCVFIPDPIDKLSFEGTSEQAIQMHYSFPDQQLMLFSQSRIELTARLEISDLSGRTLWATPLLLHSGENPVEMPANILSSGLYLLKLSSAQFSVTKKIVMVR